MSQLSISKQLAQLSLRRILLFVASACAALALVTALFDHLMLALGASMVLVVTLECRNSLREGAQSSPGLGATGQSTTTRNTFDWPGQLLLITMLFFVCGYGGFTLLAHLDGVSEADGTKPGMAFFLLVVSLWALAWLLVEWLADIPARSMLMRRVLGIVIPVLFGAGLLMLWEVFTRALNVPQVLLPSPSAIADRFGSSLPILWADFKQTFLKAVLIGYVIGCSAGFVVAVLIDRSPFLQRGLLPVGNLVSALPIVGIAPIMVMWFGFDWPSKAAVVVVMTFFPMLVNTISGLAAANHMQLDLMKTYAASYWQNLFKLRLPQALPFIFNALKINSTLALIGAIVAEFFGTPIVGMGFRISTEVGRMNVDMVWAEIAVAAIAGSCFYGLIALIERMLTFWHPSIRSE